MIAKNHFSKNFHNLVHIVFFLFSQNGEMKKYVSEMVRFAKRLVSPKNNVHSYNNN